MSRCIGLFFVPIDMSVLTCLGKRLAALGAHGKGQACGCLLWFAARDAGRGLLDLCGAWALGARSYYLLRIVATEGPIRSPTPVSSLRRRFLRQSSGMPGVRTLLRRQ